MTKELDTVILTRDIREHRLRQGDQGVVVYCYHDGITFEVEFLAADGSTVALLTLTKADIRPLDIGLSHSPLDVSAANFKREVLDHKGVVFVHFHADWVEPSRSMLPIVEELASEMPDVKFVQVDVDRSQGLDVQYSIYSIPTYLIFKDGKHVGSSIGRLSRQELRTAIMNPSKPY
jgi:thioredoxin 1